MASPPSDYLEYYKDLAKNQEFVSLKTNREQIEFILKGVHPLGQFRKDVLQRANMFASNHRKSAEKCRDFIEKGMNYHNHKSYQGAKFMFEKAILSAPFPSEQNTGRALGMSFAHKSMVEFDLKEYESALSSCDYSLKFFETIEIHIHRVHCLRLMRRYAEALQHLNELIQRCSSNEWPDMSKHSMEQMMDLAKYIEEQLGSDHSLRDIPKQVMSPLDLLLGQQLGDFKGKVWFHPNIQIKVTETKGRHWVATGFIPKGTIILVEKPISICVHSVMKTKTCSNCYKSNITSFYPCKWCDEVLFCDENCFSVGYEAYHKYECGISGFLYSFGNPFVHVYQLMSRAGIQKVFECDEQNSGFDFKTYVESQRQQITNKHSEEDNDFETDFKKFYSLAGIYEIEDPETNVFLCTGALETAFLFFSLQLDFNIEQNYDKFLNLAEICFKCGRRVEMNLFGWEKTELIKGILKKQNYGSCVSPVAALVNHSCIPNVQWQFVCPKMVMKTIQDINAGQEVCINYGPNARTMPFLERQKILKTNYMFDCNCVACLRDCDTVLCIRCLHCSGPVVPTELETTFEREYRCLHCGHIFENLKQTVDKVNELKNRFEEMIAVLENDNTDPTQSLSAALNMLKELKQLVYSESQPLKDYYQKMTNAYFRHNLGDKAIELMANISD